MKKIIFILLFICQFVLAQTWLTPHPNSTFPANQSIYYQTTNLFLNSFYLGGSSGVNGYFIWNGVRINSLADLAVGVSNSVAPSNIVFKIDFVSYTNTINNQLLSLSNSLLTETRARIASDTSISNAILYTPTNAIITYVSSSNNLITWSNNLKTWYFRVCLTNGQGAGGAIVTNIISITNIQGSINITNNINNVNTNIINITNVNTIVITNNHPITITNIQGAISVTNNNLITITNVQGAISVTNNITNNNPITITNIQGAIGITNNVSITNIQGNITNNITVSNQVNVAGVSVTNNIYNTVTNSISISNHIDAITVSNTVNNTITNIITNVTTNNINNPITITNIQGNIDVTNNNLIVITNIQGTIDITNNTSITTTNINNYSFTNEISITNIQGVIDITNNISIITTNINNSSITNEISITNVQGTIDITNIINSIITNNIIITNINPVVITNIQGDAVITNNIYNITTNDIIITNLQGDITNNISISNYVNIAGVSISNYVNNSITNDISISNHIDSITITNIQGDIIITNIIYNSTTNVFNNYITNITEVILGITNEIDPLFTNWLSTNTYIQTEVDPIFTNWLSTNTYLQIETDPAFTNWLTTNLYIQTEIDPIFTNWLMTNVYIQTETDPVFTNWLTTNSYIQTETDPVFTNWLTTNTYVQLEADPIFTNWLTTNTYVQLEADPIFTNWLTTNTYLQTETDPVFTNWLATNVTVSIEIDPIFTNWLATNITVTIESDPIFTNWLITNTTYLIKSGDTMLGNLDMGGYSITNVATNSIVFADGVILNSEKVSEITRISRRTEFTNNIFVVGGSITNTISTNYPYYVYLLTNNAVFSIEPLSTNTSRGEISAYIWATNNTVTFDWSIATAGLNDITFSNDRPTLIRFLHPPYATNWFAFKDVSFPDIITGAFPEAVTNGGGGGGTTLTNGLIAYYSFDAPISGGEYADDLTGTYNLYNNGGGSGYSTVAGKISNCIKLESPYPKLKSVVQLPHNIDYGTGWSISTWVQNEGSSGYNEAFIAQLNDSWSGCNGLVFGYYDVSSSKVVQYGRGGSCYGNADSGATYLGNWVHWVMTVNDTTDDVTLYKDGVPLSSTTLSGTTVDTYLTVGWLTGEGHFFRGKIDELGVWERPLTSGEVELLYNSGSGLDKGSF